MNRPVIVTAAVLGLLTASSAAALAAPTASKAEYACTQKGFGVCLDRSGSYLTGSPTKHTMFKLIHGDELEQKGTTRCLAFAGRKETAGKIVFRKCVAGNEYQLFTVSGKQIIVHAASEGHTTFCLASAGSGKHMQARGCSGKGPQEFSWF